MIERSQSAIAARSGAAINRWVLVALVFFGILVSYVDRGNLSLAAPVLLSEFKWPLASMGLLLSLFFWTYGICQLPAGLLIDRLGVRRAYFLAFLVWSLASAALALAPNIQTMCALRLLLGAAEAVAPLASLALIRYAFAESERGLPVSIYIAGQTLGPAFGSVVGTALIQTAGWRAMFAVTGLAALIWLPFWLRFAPRAKFESSQSARLSPNWRQLLRMPALWALSACVFLLSYFWYFVLTWMPSYLSLARHYSILAMGRTIAIPFFVMAPMNVLCGWMADRLSAHGRNPVAIRLAFGAAGLLGAASLATVLRIASGTTLLATFIIAFSSFGVASTNFWAVVQHLAPAAYTARAVAWFNTISQIAGAVAPLLTGYTLGPSRNFAASIILAAAAAGVAACLLLATGTRGVAALRRQFEAQG